MFTEEMVDKIDKFLHKNCNIIFDFEFNGLLLLFGGAIKSLIMDLPVNDLDFLLLTNEHENILEFIKKYNLNYRMKLDYVYTVNYNGYEIDISYVNDLLVNGYNTDLLFYDIHRKQFIPIGIKQAIEKRKVIVYGYHGYPNYKKRMSLKKRLNSAIKFIQFMNGDNKKVKIIKKNRYYKRLVIAFLKNPKKIKKLTWSLKYYIRRINDFLKHPSKIKKIFRRNNV